jgi:IS30 family transposase
MVVEQKLEARRSPEQISAWLAETYLDDPEMQVSHETIYQSLFVQSRGALRKELRSCLRTGRAVRRAKAYTKQGVGQGQLTNMVMISERLGRGQRPGPATGKGISSSGRR